MWIDHNGFGEHFDIDFPVAAFQSPSSLFRGQVNGGDSVDLTVVGFAVTGIHHGTRHAHVLKEY